MTYTAPAVEDLGTIAELTNTLNKVGAHPDVYSAIVPIVGSVIPGPTSS